MDEEEDEAPWLDESDTEARFPLPPPPVFHPVRMLRFGTAGWEEPDWLSFFARRWKKAGLEWSTRESVLFAAVWSAVERSETDGVPFAGRDDALSPVRVDTTDERLPPRLDPP